MDGMTAQPAKAQFKVQQHAQNGPFLSVQTLVIAKVEFQHPSVVCPLPKPIWSVKKVSCLDVHKILFVLMIRTFKVWSVMKL